MNEAACTEEQFLNDVENHRLTVIRDDGVNRHIRLRESGTFNCSFDLITWPGYLCITGDFGTYVFNRVEDMFTFFRNGERSESRMYINPIYWGEKLESIDRIGGYREYDADCFVDRVTSHFRCFWEDEEDDKAEQECWEAIKSSVLSMADDEMEAYVAVRDFSFNKSFYFQDFFDSGGTERFTARYLWCLYAIVWGIDKYDALKLETP